MAEIVTLTEIEHPYLPHLRADVSDIDQLCFLYRLVKEQKDRLQACEFQVRKALSLLTEGETKTRRLQGNKFTVKLTFPSDYWQQGTLKELWHDDPEQSQIYLRIASWAPNLREVKKMETCTGNERFESYKEKLLSARSPATYPPTVSLEAQP